MLNIIYVWRFKYNISCYIEYMVGIKEYMVGIKMLYRISIKMFISFIMWKKKNFMEIREKNLKNVVGEII